MTFFPLELPDTYIQVVHGSANSLRCPQPFERVEKQYHHDFSSAGKLFFLLLAAIKIPSERYRPQRSFEVSLFYEQGHLVSDTRVFAVSIVSMRVYLSLAPLGNAILSAR